MLYEYQIFFCMFENISCEFEPEVRLALHMLSDKAHTNKIGLDLDLFVIYVMFNSQGIIATGSLQVKETSAYCTVNHCASASNYQLSNMKCSDQDSNRRPQRLEARTLHH